MLKGRLRRIFVWGGGLLSIGYVLGWILRTAVSGNGLHKTLKEKLGDDFAWSVLETLGYGVTAVDKNDQFVYTNLAFAQLLGYTPEQIIGQTPYAFTHPDDQSKVKIALQKRHRQQSSIYELRLLHKDGHTVYAQVTGVPNVKHEYLHSVAVIADITVNREAELREQKQKDLAEALQATATKLNSTLELEELLDHILENMGKVVPHDGTGIMFIEGDMVNAVRFSIENKTISQQDLITNLSIPLNKSPILMTILHNDQPTVIENVTENVDWTVISGFEWVRSFAAAAIHSDGEKIGFLIVLSAQIGFFREEHAVALQAFADQAGLAVKNAHLYRRTKQRAQRLQWVNEMSVSMNLQQDVHEIMQVAIRGITFALGVDQVALAMFDPSGKILTIMADNPASGIPSLKGETLPLTGNVPIRMITETEKPIVCFDVLNDPMFASIRPLIQQRQTKSTLIAPLIVHDKVIGSVGFDTIHNKHHFTPEEIQLAQTFANLIATRIDLAQVLESERLRRRELEAVQNATLSLATLLKLPQVLEAILKSLASAFTMRAADIFLYEEEQLTFGLGIRPQGITTEPYAPPREGGLTYQIVYAGDPLFIADSHTHQLYENAPAAWGQFAIAGLPLKIGDVVVGVLDVSYGEVHYFAPFEKRMLTLFANQAAIAIHNARLHEQAQNYTLELERRVLERTAELNAERYRLQTVLDAAGEAIYFTDEYGRIQYANATTEKTTGYKVEELLGEYATVWRGKTVPEILNTLETTVAQGKTWHGEVINQHKNGNYYDAILNLNPLQDVDGKHIGYVGILRDVTLSKELERLKGQFVSRIGHELRTPLTNISMYLDLLKRGNQEKQERYMFVLQDEMTRLQKLVDAFLELSRLDTDSEPVTLQATEVHVAVVHVVDYWRQRASERGIELVLDEQRPYLIALASPELLHDTLSPILENAIQYSPQNGRVQLTLSQKTEQKIDWVVCDIQDSGAGIPDDELARIFDRFFRGAITNNYKTAGAGLGLAIAQINIKKLEGMIRVQSTPDKGALFSVWLKADKRESR